MTADELREYFTKRLVWAGIQYPASVVTDLLARVEQYAATRPSPAGTDTTRDDKK